MLRGGRAPPMGYLADSLRGTTVVPSRDLLLAMAPIPRGEAFRVSGWPNWLLPSAMSMSRSIRTRRNESETLPNSR
jgi:hypothetical protein